MFLWIGRSIDLFTSIDVSAYYAGRHVGMEDYVGMYMCRYVGCRCAGMKHIDMQVCRYDIRMEVCRMQVCTHEVYTYAGM